MSFIIIHTWEWQQHRGTIPRAFSKRFQQLAVFESSSHSS